ncbi:hypothetical protein B0T14DRAFT_7595 [Immersiella caudata]|uniref:Uncharacterized protein n=1 Tax=Immersiella caudata TaxID=314043 RepID=A0AA39XDK4_9PEZI|nr:hypothetical protein B0T14DRAFT_7595 [Immersiella caudata]
MWGWRGSFSRTGCRLKQGVIPSTRFSFGSLPQRYGYERIQRTRKILLGLFCTFRKSQPPLEKPGWMGYLNGFLVYPHIGSTYLPSVSGFRVALQEKPNILVGAWNIFAILVFEMIAELVYQTAKC